MSLEFFGQFLLRQGEVDDAQLRQALDLMDELNATLGELAVQQSFASEADCRRVNAEQRRKDLPFGELAMQMGILNGVELEELLLMQQRSRTDLRQALVELGCLPEDRAQALHDEWKSSQAEEASASAELPGALAGNRAAEVSVSSFGRMCLRVAGLPVKVGTGSQLTQRPGLALAASVTVHGARSLRMGLCADAPFGEKLAKGLLGMELDTLAAELAGDALGEFLNVWIGNVVATLAEEAIELRLEPPSYDVHSTSGWIFEVVTEADGGAAIVLEPLG